MLLLSLMLLASLLHVAGFTAVADSFFLLILAVFLLVTSMTLQLLSSLHGVPGLAMAALYVVAGFITFASIHAFSGAPIVWALGSPVVAFNPSVACVPVSLLWLACLLLLAFL
jgi:hypothetical protein